MQCFRCYSYGHITVQCPNREACGRCSIGHSSKVCLGDQPNKCTLCKGSHKAWDKSCPMKKQEMERISQALASTPYRYPLKPTGKTPATPSLGKDEEIVEDCMDVTPDPNLASSQPALARKPPQTTKFLAAGALPIPQLSQKKTTSKKIPISSKNSP